MDKRFEALTRRIDRFMIWSFGTSLTMAAIIIGVLNTPATLYLNQKGTGSFAAG